MANDTENLSPRRTAHDPRRTARDPRRPRIRRRRKGGGKRRAAPVLGSKKSPHKAGSSGQAGGLARHSAIRITIRAYQIGTAIRAPITALAISALLMLPPRRRSGWRSVCAWPPVCQGYAPREAFCVCACDMRPPHRPHGGNRNH